jgi:transposase
MARRQYTREFKVSAIEMVTRKGYTVHQAAKELGIDHKTLRDWIKKPSGMEGAEAENLAAEVRRLRKENLQLRQEREILKKAAAYFAKEHA